MGVSEKTALRHDKWKRRILNIIRTEPSASRISVKRLSGLSMDTTLCLVEELLNDGLVVDVGKEEPTHAGRRANLLELNPEGAYFIGLRFGGMGLTAVCLNFRMEKIAQVQKELSDAPDTAEVVDGMLSVVSQLVDGLGTKAEKLCGIGVGAPGIIQLETGIVERYAHVPDWHDVPVAGLLKERFGVPVWVEQGTKCTARELANHDGSKDLLFLQIGRGLKLCAMNDGLVLKGSSDMSGEIGHVYMKGCERLCTCGRRGCLETLVSNNAMSQDAKKDMANHPEKYPALSTLCADGNVLVSHIKEAADQGDEGCVELLMNAGNALGEVLSGTVQLMNPETVVISGRVCTSVFFRDAVQKQLNDHCLPESLKRLSLRFLDSDWTLDAAGAARLPYEHLFAED